MLEPPYDRVTVVFEDDREPLVVRDVAEFARSRFPTTGEEALQIIDRPSGPSDSSQSESSQSGSSERDRSRSDSPEGDSGRESSGHDSSSRNGSSHDGGSHDNVLQARIPGLPSVELILARPEAVDHIRLESGGETYRAQPDEVLS